MFIHKTWRIVFLALAGWIGSVSFSLAQTPSQDFDRQARADFQMISDYINGQFARSMGFYSTLGWNTPPGVFNLLGSPKVEVGVGAGADIVGLSGINGLPLQALLVSANVSLPSAVPIPFPIATVRVGLLNGLDIGFRLSYLPVISLPIGSGFSANYTGWGLDFRYKIFEATYLPTVTVAASWDTMNGTFSLGTKINQTSTYNDNGTNYSVNVTGTNTFTQNWGVNSFGAQLMVGKDLGMIFPFGAIGFQRNSGTISASIAANGQFTVSPNPQQSFNYLITSSSGPVIFEPKYVLGFDLGEGFHWAVVGESNGTDIAGSTSFRIQF